MTGNSIDGVDLVLTYFNQEGEIRDLCSYNMPFGMDIYKPIRDLQKAIAKAKGNMQYIATHFETTYNNRKLNFDSVQNHYITTIARAINKLIEKAKTSTELTTEFDLDQIDVIGLHGQTCDHCPPSRVGGAYWDKVYTVQIGNGQQLANLTGITVIYDFRSDDLMHGGEAAPLAPMHNQHLAENAKYLGKFPVTFCNAGNTGNLAHITLHKKDDKLSTMGWDTGPFNHYPDQLVRQYKNEKCDWNGRYGNHGQINMVLLKRLFDHSVKMESGANYLLKAPPKSGDPNYYQKIPMLDDVSISFEDKLRTCEYFAAYAFFHSLSLTSVDLHLPHNFALFGGGWQNPIALKHFEGLLSGDWANNPLLTEHKEIFETTINRLRSNAKEVFVAPSSAFGFDGTVMEARIFADMARCRLTGKPFSTPQTTGANKACIAGIVRYPYQDSSKATNTFKSWLLYYNTEDINLDDPSRFDPRWSRASSGWHKRTK